MDRLSELPQGLGLYRRWLSPPAQAEIVAKTAEILAAAPPFRPSMPRSGRPFSVMMSNAGRLGWVSDQRGYRYERRHPETGRPWPAIPEAVLAVWRALAPYPAPPEACLINLYAADARMGLHQDRDETALEAPVVSISLGASAGFRIGGPRRDSPTWSLVLESGDVAVLAGAARLSFHGIDRVFAGTSPLPGMPEGIERINLTLRRVTIAAS